MQETLFLKPNSFWRAHATYNISMRGYHKTGPNFYYLVKKVTKKIPERASRHQKGIQNDIRSIAQAPKKDARDTRDRRPPKGAQGAHDQIKVWGQKTKARTTLFPHFFKERAPKSFKIFTVKSLKKRIF